MYNPYFRKNNTGYVCLFTSKLISKRRFWTQRVKEAQLLLELFVRDVTDHRNGLGSLVPGEFQPALNECLEMVMDKSIYLYILM